LTKEDNCLTQFKALTINVEMGSMLVVHLYKESFNGCKHLEVSMVFTYTFLSAKQVYRVMTEI